MVKFNGIAGGGFDERVKRCEARYGRIAHENGEATKVVAAALASAGLARGYVTYQELAAELKSLRNETGEEVVLSVREGVLSDAGMRLIDAIASFLSVQAYKSTSVTQRVLPSAFLTSVRAQKRASAVFLKLADELGVARAAGDNDFDFCAKQVEKAWTLVDCKRPANPSCIE